MLTSPPPPSSRSSLLVARQPLEHQSVNKSATTSSSTNSTTETKQTSQQHPQQQQSGTASIVEVTALRFDVERARAVIEQKTKQVHRLETENSRLAEQLDNVRALESDRRANNETTLLTEIDSLKRTVRVTRDEKVALELANESLRQKLETAERRVTVLRQFEESNELLQKDITLKDTDISKLRREVALLEKRLQEATQTSLCNVLQGKVQALEAMVDERDKTVYELRSNCSDLESNLADTRDLNDELKDRCNQMDILMAEMRVAMSGLRSDLAANERLVESQYSDFAKRQEDLQAAKGHVEQRCNLLEELNSELRGEAREANRRAQDRQFVITELQNELSVTRQELSSARHAAQCAEEDERSTVDRLKKIQMLAGDREGEIARQHLLEQSLRAELESYRAATAAARSDADRLRQEMNESSRRADLLSHQAAQREGAEERVRQMERQLQRTLEENDVLRENLANARRRDVDSETILVKQRDQLARIDRLQSELEEREVRIAALRREKQLSEAELDALRQDLARARAGASTGENYLRPQVSPTRTKMVKVIVDSPTRSSTSNPTSVAFGRHATPPPTTTSPIKRGLSPRIGYDDYIPPALRSVASTIMNSTGRQMSPSRQQNQSSSNSAAAASLLVSKRNLANANSSRNLISATVFTPERPHSAERKTQSSRVGPRQM